MSAATFDTLKLSRRLEAAGFSREQSAGMTEALNDALSDTVVTRDYLDTRLARTEADLKADIARVEADLKADIARVETDLKADIARVETDLKADIAKVDGNLRAVEYRLTIKLGGMIVVAVGAAAALVKLL